VRDDGYRRLDPSDGLGVRSPLAFLFVTVFVDMAGYGILIPLLPFYAREFGASAALVGLLASLYAAAQMLGAPLLGTLSDRVGRRPILLACLLGASVAYLILGLAGSLLMVTFAVAVAGFMGGTPATAQACIADRTAPEERAKGLGLIGAAFGLGLMAGPAIGGFLSLYSLAAPALAASALALSNAVFGFFALEESLPPERRSRARMPSMNPLAPVKNIWRVLSLPAIRILLLVVFLFNLSFAGLLTNFPLFSEARFGWGPATNAFFFAFVGVCAVVTQGFLIGRGTAKFGEGNLLVAGLSVAAVGFAAMAAAPSSWMLYPVVGGMAVGIGLAIPSLASLISRRVSGDEQGRLMGGQQAILSSTLILGPIVAGLSFDVVGVSAPYFIGSLLAGGALGAALAFRKRDGEEAL
jgi:MFS family permease